MVTESRLGRQWNSFYGGGVIGFLRFVGMLNAAVWLGAAVFCTLGAGPALVSHDMLELLGPKHFPYLSGAITQLVSTRLFHWQIGCAVLALVHMVAERLYRSRAPRRFWPLLLAGLLGLSLYGGLGLVPKLNQLHRVEHALNTPPTARAAAAHAFRFWRGIGQAVNVLLIGGVLIYFWRVTHPPDELSFVSPTKFRS